MFKIHGSDPNPMPVSVSRGIPFLSDAPATLDLVGRIQAEAARLGKRLERFRVRPLLSSRLEDAIDLWMVGDVPADARFATVQKALYELSNVGPVAWVAAAFADQPDHPHVVEELEGLLWRTANLEAIERKARVASHVPFVFPAETRPCAVSYRARKYGGDAFLEDLKLRVDSLAWGMDGALAVIVEVDGVDPLAPVPVGHFWAIVREDEMRFPEDTVGARELLEDLVHEPTSPNAEPEEIARALGELERKARAKLGW